MGRYSPSELKPPTPPTLRSTLGAHRADVDADGNVAGIERLIRHVRRRLVRRRRRLRLADLGLDVLLFLQPHEVDQPPVDGIIERAAIALDQRLHQQEQREGRHRAQRHTQYVSNDHGLAPLLFRGDGHFGHPAPRAAPARPQLLVLRASICLDHQTALGVLRVQLLDLERTASSTRSLSIQISPLLLMATSTLTVGFFRRSRHRAGTRRCRPA
jgi:hypothetical protein